MIISLIQMATTYRGIEKNRQSQIHPKYPNAPSLMTDLVFFWHWDGSIWIPAYSKVMAFFDYFMFVTAAWQSLYDFLAVVKSVQNWVLYL